MESRPRGEGPEPVPAQLVEEETRSRLASVQPVQARRWRPAIVGATSLVVFAVIAAIILAVERGGPPPLAPPPPALLRIDPNTHSVVQAVGVRPDDLNSILAATNGTLWQRSGDVLIGRSIADGADTVRIETDPLAIRRFDAVFGFGSAWTFSDAGYPFAPQRMKVTRYDQVSGRATHLRVPGSVMRNQYANAFRSFLPGPDGIWYLSGTDQRLRLIEPSNRVRSWSTGVWLPGDLGPTQLLPTERSVWLCAPFENELRRFDTKTHQVVNRMKSVDGACPVAVTTHQGGGNTVWVLDREKALVSEIDGETGDLLSQAGVGPAREGPAIGPSAYGFGALWFPAGPAVYRFDLATRTSETIQMPSGVEAATVVADVLSGTLWISNCDPSYCAWILR